MPGESCLNPFPGLRPFETDEEYLFFGREGQSEEILRRLREHRFLAVIGTSGSGKSSLIRAGLLPYLYGGFMAGAGSQWRVATLRPGSDPIGNLAHVLNAPAVLGGPGESADEAARSKILLEVTLRRTGLGLIEAVRLARLPEGERVLVIVDQFEELFRFAEEPSTARQQDDAAAFVKLLLEATAQNALPIYVVLTMRSEFIGDCAKFRDLPEAVTAGPYLIPWMTREQRRLAIEEPVRVVTATIAPRLVTRLLNDGGENPDQLPILQHCLMRTWDYWQDRRRDGEPIDLDQYLAVGGIENALSIHADTAYQELPDERLRAVARRVFQALTEKGSDNREIRRPTTVARIAAAADAEVREVISVAEYFRRPGHSFLMPPSNVPLDENSVLDISHESLIRGWDRLKAWVEEEAESAKTYRRLAEWAERWSQKRAALWMDPDLQNSLDWRQKEHPTAVWAGRYHPGFAQAMEFLDESLKEAAARKQEAERRKAEEEQRKAEELRTTRAHLKIVGALCLLFAVALFFAVVAVNYYLKQTKTARRLTETTQENEKFAKKSESLAKQSQNRTLEVALGELQVFDDLPETFKNSPEFRRANEHVLEEAKSASEQILQEDNANDTAKMILAISRAMLLDLHGNQAKVGTSEASSVMKECEQDMEEADQMAQGPHRDLTSSGLLLASSAETLQKLGKKADARKVALLATQRLEEASRELSWDLESRWRVLATSYSGALRVLQRGLPGQSQADGLAGDAGRTSGIGRQVVKLMPSHALAKLATAKGRSNPGTSLIADFAKVAVLEESLGQKDEAVKTYQSATRLGDRLVTEPTASQEQLQAVFWLYADLGSTYADRSSWDEAEKAYGQAETLRKRIPDDTNDGRLDHLAILQFLGNAQQGRAKGEKDPALKSRDLKRALEYHEQSSKLGEEFEGSHPDQLRLGTLLKFSSAADYLMMGEKDRAEQQLEQRLALLQRHLAEHTLQNDTQLYEAYSGAKLMFENNHDYAVARDWIDRGIKELTKRTTGAGSPQEKTALVHFLSEFYGSRSWGDLFVGDFERAIRDAQHGFNLDRTNVWILTNQAHGYLFAGKYDRARQIYLANADKQASGKTFRDAVFDDFKEFFDHGNSKMNFAEVRRIQAELGEPIAASARTLQ